MSDTLYALQTWRERNGLRPLRDVAAEQAARLRAVHAPRPEISRNTGGRAATGRSVVADRIAAVRADSRYAPAVPAARPAPVAMVTPRERFAEADRLAASVPVGLYALPRREASSAGNTVTFFKVHPYRGGHRIVQLLGSIGSFAERPLPVEHQIFALRHIAEDARSASTLFGRETSTCGVCGSPLTNETSRKAGIGPKCARKF